MAIVGVRIATLAKQDITKANVEEDPTTSNINLDNDVTIPYASTRPAPSATKYITKRSSHTLKKTPVLSTQC